LEYPERVDGTTLSMTAVARATAAKKWKSGAMNGNTESEGNNKDLHRFMHLIVHFCCRLHNHVKI